MRDDERLALAASAIGGEGADSIEAVVTDTDRTLTRFTEGGIHQNVAADTVTVRIRAVVDGRAGSASTNRRDPASLDDARHRAIAQAKFSPMPDVAIALPGPAAYAPPSEPFDEATATAPPELRARAAAEVFDVAKDGGTWAAGYVATARDAIAIANSHGVRASFAATSAAMNVKCIGAEASGYAEAFSHRVGDLDARAVAERAAAKARDAGTPQGCDVGEWTVVLEPAALGELVHYLLPHFSAQRVDEGASFLSDGLGKSYVGDNVTLVDDYAHPLHRGTPFDFEGTPSTRVVLLDGGAGRAFVTDAEWSQRLGVPNTGHFIPDSVGPQARYPVLLPGDASREELIASTKRGILISRFWYIRVVDQRKTIVTGMTRDGTFLIEDGRIVRGLRNLRFNVSILALMQACRFSNEQVCTGGYSYRMVAPAARIERFAFSSVTAF